MIMTGYRDIIFGTRKQAHQTLLDMDKIIRKYGYASEADLYDSVCKTADYNMLKRGWTNLNEAYAQPTTNGYILMMPPTISLDKYISQKEKHMNLNDIEKALWDAVVRSMTGTLQINGARVPVRLTSISTTTDELPTIVCDVLTPTKEMQLEEYYPELAQRAKRMLNSVYGAHGQYGPQIKDVIYSPPATVVFWKDNTKTVVKAEGEEYDPEKGLAMAIAKKTLGNKHDYYNTFKKWLKKAPKTDAK